MSKAPFTVLLAEDDNNDALLFHRAFRKLETQAQLQVVTDGDQVIAYLSGRGSGSEPALAPLPGLLLLDLKLPRRSGLEVLKWLRQQPRLRRLPVVILTSSKQPSDIERAYELGANSYLLKPIGLDALIHLVQLVHQYWIQTNQNPLLEL
jgi:CheY-like chemotaxis protein